jgi:hypothetical protein
MEPRTRGRPPTDTDELKVRLPSQLVKKIRASAGEGYGALGRRVEALLAKGLEAEGAK